MKFYWNKYFNPLNTERPFEIMLRGFIVGSIINWLLDVYNLRF